MTYHPCAVCPRRRLFSTGRHKGGVVIPPNGPQPCRILFVGEAGAKDEEAAKEPFAGVTGGELDMQYLPLAYLSRPDVRVTNAVLCSLPGHRNPTKEEGQACLRAHFPAELLRTRPSIIVPMGAVACSNLCPDLPLAREYGLPTADYTIPWADWTGTIVPMYHPAAGLYDQSFAIMVAEAFRNLKLIQQGTFERPTDEYKGDEDYALITTGRQLDSYFSNYPYHAGTMALDTEYDPRAGNAPHCLSFSLAPGTGRMILADSGVLQTFAGVLAEGDFRYIFHNALADHRTLVRMGISLDWRRVSDTMLAALSLGLPRLGLKTLAYRLTGCDMQDFTDIIEPHNLAAALDYMRSIVALGRRLDMRKHQPWLGKRQRTLDSKAATAVKNTLEKDSNPIQIWDGWPDEDRELAIEHLGPFPTLGVNALPLAEQIVYSCRDSDCTLRLDPILRRRRASLRREMHA